MKEVYNLIKMMSILNIKVNRLKANESNAVDYISHVNLQIVKLQDEGNKDLASNYAGTKGSLVKLRKAIATQYKEELTKFQTAYDMVVSNITKLSGEELLELKVYLENEVLKLNGFVEILGNSNEELASQCYKTFYGANVLPVSGEDFRVELLQDIESKKTMFSNLSNYISGIIIARTSQKK